MEDNLWIRREKKSKKKLIAIFTVCLMLLIVGVFAFTASVSNFNLRTKNDFGGSSSSNSTSFDQRSIIGNQPVSQYTGVSYTGRFGVLDDIVKVLVILNSHSEGDQIIRGGGSTAEDDLGLINNYLTVRAKTYTSDNNYGLENANCSFYLGAINLGSNITNSTGDCVFSYLKTSLTPTDYLLLVNYTYTDTTISKVVENSSVNVSLVKFNLPNTIANYSVSGGTNKFRDGDVAKFKFNITKTNSSGLFYYDPLNIVVNATDSADVPYPETSYVLGYRLNKTDTGVYEVWVVTNISFGTPYLRWKAWVSDDNFATYIATAVHTDVEITNETCTVSNACAATTCSGSTCTDGCGNVYSGTKDCGGGGPTEPTCKSTCSSGETQTTCVTESTLRTRSCGNYDEDSCLEWGSESFTNCEGLEICENGVCNPRNCDNYWNCEEWAECLTGMQQRTCINTECNLTDRIETQTCEVCQENWQCEWTLCLDDETKSLPYNCIDANNCETEVNKPTERDCFNPYEGCSGSWQCSSWGECVADYDINEILSGVVSKDGTQVRNCFDKNSVCNLNISEKKICNYAIPISASKVEWCNETYVEVTDEKTQKLVSRVKESEIKGTNIERIDVNFVMTEFSGYCEFCYDGVKNYDEIGVDCGGKNCPACLRDYKFFNWLFWLVLILWCMFIVLLVSLIREEEEEEGIMKLTVGEATKVFKPITKVEETKREERIIDWFKELFRKKEKKIKYKVVEKQVGVKSPRELMLGKMKIKLAELRREGYAGTLELEGKIKDMENSVVKERKTFVTRIKEYYRKKKIEKEKKKIKYPKPRKSLFALWLKKLVEKRTQRKVEKEKEARKDLASERIRLQAKERFKLEEARAKERREKEKELEIKRIAVEKQRFKEQKLKEKEIKKREKAVAKKIKTEKKVRRKERKTKIRALKREIRNKKIASLMAKLRLWKKQGYYGTEHLEAELRRLQAERD